MEDILEHLIDYVGQNFPDAKMVDEDYGQLDILDDPNRDTYPLVYPAVLIDATETEWSQLKGPHQIGQTTVRVRLIIDCYDDTHYGSTTTLRIHDRVLMRKELHKLLQGHRCGETQALIRQASRFYTQNHGIKVYESSYTVGVIESIESDTVKSLAKPSIKTVVR